jgi:hypothetical protein
MPEGALQEEGSASEPAGAPGSTADGRDPGSSRRRSLVVVAWDPHHAKKGAAARAAAAVVQQCWLTLMALGLALMTAPVAAAIELCAALFTKALPNFEPSLPCQGLLTERRSIHLVALAALVAFLAQNGFQVAAVEANSRAMSYVWHTMLLGLAACVVLPLWYASVVSSPSVLHVFATCCWTGFLCYFVPCVSFAVLGLARAKRRSCKRTALEIALGTTISVSNVLLGLVSASYVALSGRVTGGLAGLGIIGKGRRTCEAGLASS